jgi:hypothetical protein
LNGDGLAERPGAEVLFAHRSDLTIGFANPSLSPSGDPHSWWRDQSRDDALSLVFDSPPLEECLDLMGEPIFRLRVRADKPVAKLCARLSEVTAEGRSNFICYGLLNLTHRASDTAPTPLVPGVDYDVALKGRFACYRLSRGSRIRVALSETWWPVVWPSPELVTLQITAGVSTIELPVRPSRDGEPPPFGQFRDRYAVPDAQAAPYTNPLLGVEISGDPGSRTFTLTGGGGSLAPGIKTIPGINTTITEVYNLRRSIREDDPTTAEIEVEAVNVFERDEWRVKVRSHCRCRATRTHFLCSESFEASLGDEVVCARSWDKAVERQLL